MEKIVASSKLKWKVEEDDKLRALVQLHGGKRWKLIATHFVDPPRTFTQCHNRWAKVLDPKMNKGPWTKQEDDELLRLLSLHPAGVKIHWNQLCGPLEGRNGKQSRERWLNHLDPKVDKRAFTLEEDAILMREYFRVGSKWTEISRTLAPGRTENRVKNHFNVAMKRKIRGCTGFDEAWKRYTSAAGKKRKACVPREQNENTNVLNEVLLPQVTDDEEGRPNPFASPCSRNNRQGNLTTPTTNCNPHPLYAYDLFSSPQLL